MSTPNKVGWFTLAFLAALALAMAWSAAAHAEQPPPPIGLVARLVVAQPALQSRKDTPVDARELAEAIAAIPHVNSEWAALVLTIAAHESALSARIARGDCLAHECDGGRAWGLFQMHRNLHNAEQWGSPDLGVQALAASRALRSSFYQCGGAKHPDWALRTIRAYAGRGCENPLRGEERRMATFERLRRRL